MKESRAKHAQKQRKDGISLRYRLSRQGRDDLVFDFSQALSFERNVVGVYGQSGTGKSTMLKAIAGLIKGAEYSLAFDGHAYTNLSASNNPCVYVGAESILFEHLDVKGNLHLVIRQANYATFAKLDLDDVLDICGIKHLLNQKPSALSSGEQQRVKFARALLCGKPFILLDEAFSALDWQTRYYFIDLLASLQQRHGFVFMLVSHSLRELALCCNSIIHLHEGIIAAYGDIHSMLNKLQNTKVADEQQNDELFSLLHVKVIAYDEQSRLVECLLDSASSQGIIDKHSDAKKRQTIKPDTESETLYLRANTALKINSMQRIALDADKVSLAKAQAGEAVQTSMLNHLQGTVVSVNKEPDAVVVTLLVGGQRLQSLISIRSFNQLNIKLGDTMLALFKAL